jgi:hypothetical protein
MRDNKTMKTIMFGTQIAKQFQSNGQKYQDDMKDNPKSAAKIKSKKQKKIKFQTEGKVIEAYVTHWQEQEKKVTSQFSKGRSKKYKFAMCRSIGGEDHNFRHGAEKQLSQDTTRLRNVQHSTNGV